MRYIALDTETQGLEAKHDAAKAIHCVALAERKDGEIVSSVYDWKTGKYVIQQLLEQDDVYFLIHNASFDIPVLRTHGVHIPAGRYFCTMLAAYLTRPGTGHSLGEWGEKLGREKLEYNGGWEQYTEDMAEYCRRDTEVCLLLWEHLWANDYATDKKLRKVYLELELPYVEVIIELEGTGLHVDVPALASFKAELQTELDTIAEEIKGYAPYVPELKWDTKTKRFECKPVEYAKSYHKNKNNAGTHYTFDGKLWASEPGVVYDHCKLQPFNSNSSAHLSWVLMNQGWKPTKFSKKTGEPSTDADTIEELDYPLAKAYTKYAELSKIQGTFVDGLLSRVDSSNMVRGDFNQCITVTTRLSSSNPNLQNLPSRSELGKRVRECITAPPGYTLLVGDLSS